MSQNLFQKLRLIEVIQPPKNALDPFNLFFSDDVSLPRWVPARDNQNPDLPMVPLFSNVKSDSSWTALIFIDEESNCPHCLSWLKQIRHFSSNEKNTLHRILITPGLEFTEKIASELQIWQKNGGEVALDTHGGVSERLAVLSFPKLYLFDHHKILRAFSSDFVPLSEPDILHLIQELEDKNQISLLSDSTLDNEVPNLLHNVYINHFRDFLFLVVPIIFLTVVASRKTKSFMAQRE